MVNLMASSRKATASNTPLLPPVNIPHLSNRTVDISSNKEDILNREVISSLRAIIPLPSSLLMEDTPSDVEEAD
ncbi:hypothetical protein CDV31_004661, partial [Fusarium ambrosium]